MSERISSELKEAFKEWLKTRGIKVILFDLDDTLIETHKAFGEQEEAFLEFCRNTACNLDPEAIAANYERLNSEAYQLMGVSRKRWKHIVSGMVALYGEKVEIWNEGVDILERIYKIAPGLYKGALKTLTFCQKLGLRLGLVTHADSDWTGIKLEALNLGGFFEHVLAIDVEKHRFKGRENWEEAINLFKVEPHEVMVVGDNLNGDIKASFEAGVKTLVWIPSKWHMYNHGTLPDLACEVSGIENLIPELLAK